MSIDILIVESSSNRMSVCSARPNSLLDRAYSSTPTKDPFTNTFVPLNDFNLVL